MATAALFIALANTHAKLEVHIVRRLALHHEEHGWCGVRGCAEQLGLGTRLWDSVGPSCDDAASRCLQHGPAAPCRGGARALSDEPCVPESAQAVRWPEPSRAAAALGAARRGKPTCAPRSYGAAPMMPLAAQVHAQWFSGVGTCPGSPGPYLRTARACVRCTQRAWGEILIPPFVL